MSSLPPALNRNTSAADTLDEAPAVRLVNDTLREAARRGASDVHVEPAEHTWRIRMRIDGVLHLMPTPPAHLRDAFTTRLKVLSKLDIAERRIPQDGRLRIALVAGRVDQYRVNTLPTVFGEKLVLRRLDALPTELSLSLLGLDSAQCVILSEAIAAPHGLLLVTGPTGSGKTLSLYCLLQQINQVGRNLCSVEDPAEIQLDGVNQVSINDKAGLTFAVALRAFLRQDPDVIMVGEIRDAETADVAIKAAQTGHLVLSSLHTNDAPATLARLLDIGVAPYNLAAAVRMITAQRLLRKLCPACRQPVDLSPAALRAAGFKEFAAAAAASSIVHSAPWQPYRALGCAACHGVGYRGRVGIHQLMPVSAEMRELITTHASTRSLAALAAREGVPTLRAAALARVRDGTTSLDEALAGTEAEP